MAKIIELNLIAERIIMIFLLNHYLGVKMFSKNMEEEEELRALISEVVKFHRLQELRVLSQCLGSLSSEAKFVTLIDLAALIIKLLILTHLLALTRLH